MIQNMRIAARVRERTWKPGHPEEQRCEASSVGRENASNTHKVAGPLKTG